VCTSRDHFRGAKDALTADCNVTRRPVNMFLWMPPRGDPAGDILLADSTIFITLFGGDESLDRFWKNIATK
jgi:hypothetical protein